MPEKIIADENEIIQKKIGDKFHICDVCGYTRGFHVSFEKVGDGFKLILICPDCGQRFSVDWLVSLGRE